MKKLKKLIVSLILFLFAFFPVLPTLADINFTANSDITISGVSFPEAGDETTIDMFIASSSTAFGWEFDDGTFTVTVTTPTPGSFMVGIDADEETSVASIKITKGGVNVVCETNITSGVSYATVPTASSTYTIVPSTTTDCTSLCTAVDNAATLNAFPTCGALTCDSGYEISGSGASATCTAVATGGTFIPAPPPPTTFQTYDPITGELIIGEATTAEETTATTTPEEEPAEEETTPKPTTGSGNKASLEQMTSDAETVATGDVSQVIAKMGVGRDLAAEINFNKTVVAKIIEGSGATAEVRNTITNFVTYGTKATQILGAGERGGVVNSFKAAFGKLPSSVDDWNDVIKIANGRWPGQTNKAAEDRATLNFEITYKRGPDRSNPNDDAAITVMAYGLRPADRNLDSEKAAIKIFKDIYGYNPVKATAWDVVRAIAYSGAIR